MANIFVTGMTGTGKSYFIRYLLKQKNLPVTVVSMKEKDIDNVKEIIPTLSKNQVTSENYKNIVLLQDRLGVDNFGFYMGWITPDEIVEFMDTLSNILRSKYNSILYIDEAQNFLPQIGKFSTNLVRLVSMARENNIHVFLATQRPQDIQKSVLNNCKWKISFKLSEANAVKSMSRNFENITEDQIKSLDQYYFIIQESTTGKTEISKI